MYIYILYYKHMCNGQTFRKLPMLRDGLNPFMLGFAHDWPMTPILGMIIPQMTT